MSAQAGTVHGDQSTEQGYPTPFTGVTQGRRSEGGTTRTTGDKRAGISQVTGYEEHSLKLFKTMEKALVNVTWELFLLSEDLRACISALPWGQGGRQAQEHFQKAVCPAAPCQEPPNPEWHFLPFVWALLSHFSSPLGHILSLYARMFLGPWGHFLPVYCLPTPHSYSPGSQGGPWGAPGFT